MIPDPKDKIIPSEPILASNQKFRILIIEDEEDLLDIISDFLKDELRSAEVRKESNGFNAALQISAWSPDLILLDFMLPGMDGFEICKRIRENPQTKNIPIIGMTGLSNAENRQAVMKAGVTDFIGKPFRGAELIAKIKTLLGVLPPN